MKKFTLMLTVFILVLFTSCASGETPADKLTLPISLTANLAGSDAQFTAEIYESGCDITFSSEHSLSGTELHFSDDGNTASAGGFTRDVKQGIFPAQEALIKAVKTVASGEIKGIETENGIKYTIDEMTIMVYYDKDTEQLTGIGTEENGRRFEFNIVAVNPYETQSNSAG